LGGFLIDFQNDFLLVCMSGTYFLHFSGRLWPHQADSHGVYLNGVNTGGDGRYHDSTTVSFGHGRLISCLRAFFFDVLPAPAFFPLIWRSTIGASPLSLFVALLVEKPEPGAPQQFGTPPFLNRIRRW
jgi:hypothetical protein